MRKGWFWGLAIVLGVALAVPATGAEFLVSGDTHVSFRLYRNLFDAAPPQIAGKTIGGTPLDFGAVIKPEETMDTWTQTTKVKLGIKASENLSGYLEWDMDVFGGVWGGTSGFGKWNEKGDVKISRAYIDFKIPGLDHPVWTRVGIQPFAIRPNVFLNTSRGGGISFRSTYNVSGNALSLGTGWGKISEYDAGEYNLINTSTNLFYGLLDYKMKGMGFGFYIALVTGREAGNGKDKNGNIWWIGGYSDGKIGPMNYNLDLIFDTGQEKIKDVKPTYKNEFNGWFARAVVTYPYEKFTFGLGGLYASGDDYKKVQLKRKYSGFVLPYKADPFGPADDSLIVISGWNQSPSPAGDVGYTTNPFNSIGVGTMNLAQEGWPGIWGVRLFADYKAYDRLTLRGQVSYWGDTSKHGDSFEYPFLSSYRKDKDEDDIGFEVDLGVRIDIYKNLTLLSSFGYLWAGNAIDMKEIRGKAIEDPYAWVTTLWFTF